MMSKRLSVLSCNEEEYERTKQWHLTKTTTRNNSNRARNIIQFNRPYSQNVKSNMGKIFLKLRKKHFPKDHRLYKIFNRNTLKLSYSCMGNMSSVIKQQLQIIINKKHRLIMQMQK